MVIECEEQDNLLQKDDKVQEMFELVLRRFKATLRRGPPDFRERLQFLERQHVFVDKLVQLIKAVARESGNRKVNECVGQELFKACHGCSMNKNFLKY